jgi:pimeloyl-ACP methyl ester carboxylesterase
LTAPGAGGAARVGEARLADGRTLAYAEWGPADGRPLLHFHGVPDGRFGWGGRPACEERGVRLIAVDRPGVGGSDPKPGRSVADWAADVEELAERLGVGRFGVSGHSAGGPYALACAAGLDDRVDAAVLISGVGRLDQPGFVAPMHTARAWWLASHLPAAMAFAYTAGGRLSRRTPTLATNFIAANFPPVDRAVIKRPDVAARLRFAYLEATRAGGSRGLTDDMRTLLAPWRFDPTAITCPHLPRPPRCHRAPCPRRPLDPHPPGPPPRLVRRRRPPADRGSPRRGPRAARGGLRRGRGLSTPLFGVHASAGRLRLAEGGPGLPMGVLAGCDPHEEPRT